jgi:DNA-binding response OmpR family regulator
VDFIPVVKSAYPHVKIIMISGFDGSVKDVALENGADIYLEKPFTKSQLHDAVMQVLHAGQPAPAM